MKAPCKHLSEISENIKPHSPDEFAFTNTYKYCSARKLRIPKRGCLNCRLYEIKKETDETR